MEIPNNPNKTYKSPKGRNFRTFAIEKSEEQGKFIDGEFRYIWKVYIKFLDDNTRSVMTFGYNDEFLKIEKWC